MGKTANGSTRKSIFRRIRWNRILMLAFAVGLGMLCIKILFAHSSKEESIVPREASAVTAEVDTTTSMPTTEAKEANIEKNASYATDVCTTEFSTEYVTRVGNSTSVYSTRLNRYITDDEMYNLIMVACSEAGCESYEGKVAVIATILNRMEDTTSRFENSVYGVIFQKGQFSSALNGHYYYSNGAYELRMEDLSEQMLQDATNAVLDALNGVDPTAYATGGSLYFYNPAYCSDAELEMRNSLSNTVQIGNHIFYRVWDAPTGEVEYSADSVNLIGF